jgi:TonB-linked SusC/RagA family outer membrane protein
MKPRYGLALGLLLTALSAVPAVAQQPTPVTGQVSDSATLTPLADVQVSVPGTRLRAITDASGHYRLMVPPGRDNLRFARIGYRPVVVAVAPIVDLRMAAQAIELQEIVTTALGIEKPVGSIGQSIQEIQGDQISDVPTTNALSDLESQISGLQVTSSSSPFGASRMVIRGATSILGENQPLIVVDGVPIDNSAASVNGYSNGGSMAGYDVGNAAADINANDIASYTVLKGPNAAALYGSRAANGAIVITTKNGRGAPEGTFGVSASFSSTYETPLRLPDYQNQYGQGFYGEFKFVDGNGGGVNDEADESWGPKLDGRTTGCVMVPGTPFGTTNYDKTQPCEQFFGAGPWVAHPNNVRDFWNTGNTIQSNIAISRATENTNVRLSLGRTNMSGMYPSNTNTRTALTLTGGAQLSDRWSAEASINYTNDGMQDWPAQQYEETDPMQGFIWFGRQVDTRILQQNLYRNPNDPLTQQILAGNPSLNTAAPIPYSWNYSYHANVYWMAQVKQNTFARDRGIGHVSATFKPWDWLSITGRTARDWYQNHFRVNYPVNDISPDPLGGFEDVGETHSETNTDFLVTASDRPIFRGLTLTASAGGNARVTDFNSNTGTVTQLVIPGVYTLQNSAGQPTTSLYETHKKVNSLYGTATLDWRHWFTVDVTGRNDWSSVLPANGNSFFYPSASAALLFTEALGLKSDVLSYGKVRASWTRVGNDTDPYRLAAVYGSGTPWAGQPTFAAADELLNASLKPEQTTGQEAGVDLGFWNDRLTFNATVYQKSTSNQILPVSTSQTSGYTQAVVNSGDLRNRGLELQLNTIPIKTRDFSWTLVANWSKNTNKVVSLYGGVQRIVVGNYWEVNVTADVGQPYGNLVGTKWQRDAAGHVVVDSASGLPIGDATQQVLGNYNPDWIGGLTNTFTYKNFSLSFTIGGQVGGQIYSVTKWFGDYSGVLAATVYGREQDWNSPGIVVPNAVYQNGKPDTTHVLAQDYWHNTFYANENGMVDASYMKLRELRLAYDVPPRYAHMIGFGGATIALVGHNLAIWTHQKTLDPETEFDTGNVQGVEQGQLPTAKSVGFTITLRP